ncbi:hypothetical protein [Flavobacterium croceum]|uniref:hypothetical protein n=1 Tax=Flavobacterium croceum TaxID=370975 RepID=UPI0024A9D171|nr:hypothetical protein [Flavobacterium croceum]
MKKLFYLVLLTTFFLFSCSSNNDENAQVAPANSLKKITETVYYNSSYIDYSSATFNYENGKLASISNNNNTNLLKFTYNNDLIVEVNSYTNNNLVAKNIVVHNGNLITSITNSDNTERELFFYNAGILSTKMNQSMSNTTNNWTTYLTTNYTFNNGNIITERFIYNDNNNMISDYSYEYDSKLNPMTYMPNDLKYIIGSLESLDFVSKNTDIKTYKYQSTNFSDPTLLYSSEITYNSNNLPIKIKKYKSNGVLFSEADFEYN